MASLEAIKRSTFTKSQVELLLRMTKASLGKPKWMMSEGELKDIEQNIEDYETALSMFDDGTKEDTECTLLDKYYKHLQTDSMCKYLLTLTPEEVKKHFADSYNYLKKNNTTELFGKVPNA